MLNDKEKELKEHCENCEICYYCEDQGICKFEHDCENCPKCDRIQC